MVSHSCSASLSSSSYFSHTPCSSHSSPPSSPDSAPPSSQDSHPPTSSPASAATLALVPFLWEEKPGVLKRDMPSSKLDQDCAHISAQKTTTDDSDVYSSTSHSRTLIPIAKMSSSSSSSDIMPPRLRPPPCLSQPNHVHALPNTDEDVDLLRPHYHLSRAGVRSKVMSSFHLHRRPQHRTPSVEDDPFWMAMVACTNNSSDKGNHSPRWRCENRRDAELHRGESWIVKRVQGNSIRFEQCMPHRMSAGGGGAAVSHRGETIPARHLRGNNPKHGAHSLKTPTEAAACSSSRDARHAQAQRADAGAGSMAHHASKAFKALNLARAEVHGRCKSLLQQQSSPVDISCSTRLPKAPTFTMKRYKGDVFGCKSDHSLIVPP